MVYLILNEALEDWLRIIFQVTEYMIITWNMIVKKKKTDFKFN